MNTILIKAVRWSGWPLLPLIFLFLFTGYIMDGRYGLSRLLDEKSALTFHRMLHVPMIVLVLVPPGDIPGHAALGLDQTPRLKHAVRQEWLLTALCCVVGLGFWSPP